MLCYGWPLASERPFAVVRGAPLLRWPPSLPWPAYVAPGPKSRPLSCLGVDGEGGRESISETAWVPVRWVCRNAYLGRIITTQVLNAHMR